MTRGNDVVLRGGTARAGGCVALLASAVVSCNNEATETTTVAAPIVAGITDGTFRAAAGCPDCIVTARSTVTLPLTGKIFTEVKLASKSAPAPYSIALDGRGNVVNHRDLLSAEGKAKVARQGKLRDDAYARSLTSSSDLVPISIWADYGDGHAPREQIISNSTLRATHKAQTSSQLHAVTSKVTSWLDTHGYRTYERGTDSPIITADVPASALAELGRIDGAAIVHLRYPAQPDGFTWYDAVKGPAAHAIVGSVAGMAFCNAEGWQPDYYTYLTPYTILDSTAQSSLHTRWTSELISATASTRMAPGASLFLSAFASTEYNYSQFEAWSWCSSIGVHNMNRSSSYGQGPIGLLAEDMAQDFYVVNWPFPLITLSAGNCLGYFGQFVDCSESFNGYHVGNRSYNTLVVGASDSNTTPETDNDFLAEFSKYANPVTSHNDHELPDLVAPGSDKYETNISSASIAGDEYARGTSAAAPIVLGTVMLMKTLNSEFSSWPEMTRATILTASTHPVDGPRTTYAGGSDKRQGAGLLNANIALHLANPGFRLQGPNNDAVSQAHYIKNYDFSTDFPINGFMSEPYYILATQTGRLRIVAAWDATAQNCNPDGSGCFGETLDADLDVRVDKWDGSTWSNVCVSASWDSSWELCDIAVNWGDVYRAQLAKYSTNSTSTYVGIAWNNYDPSLE